jgi:hypothetical protein
MRYCMHNIRPYIDKYKLLRGTSICRNRFFMRTNSWFFGFIIADESFTTNIKQPIMGDKLKEVLELGYRQLVQHGAVKWLSDDRLLGPFSKENQDWCENHWFPKTRDAGWKYWAIVLPETVLGQMSLQYFEKKYSEQGITTKFFSNPDDALGWLTEQSSGLLDNFMTQ